MIIVSGDLESLKKVLKRNSLYIRCIQVAHMRDQVCALTELDRLTVLGW